MKLEVIVQQIFSSPSNCFGHCKEKAKPYLKKIGKKILCYHACPGMYVSRVIGYGFEPSELLSYINQIAPGMDIKERDIRVATRYAWDLGIGSSDERVFRVSYWTQNYGQSKVESQERNALFLCSRCNNPFVKKYISKEEKCSKCSKTA
jgi:hypothetical protein